jgi:hypothetical protein
VWPLCATRGAITVGAQAELGTALHSPAGWLDSLIAEYGFDGFSAMEGAVVRQKYVAQDISTATHLDGTTRNHATHQQ